ncbi:MAG: T9SS type A sorting domain-containing protein [Candidatus Hatepunaea meridiana]|nr:T9SS type A sorting domain-containing protein [Candidatus Hatepunaea meridiana]
MKANTKRTFIGQLILRFILPSWINTYHKKKTINAVMTGIMLLTVLFAGNLYADMLNSELSISEPEGGRFFESGETFTARLLLTDDDDNNLRVDECEDNGLLILELWVSGPRQNFNTVDPYYRYSIVTVGNGFNEDSGFDPEIGEIEIELPRALEEFGTYSIIFSAKREVNDREYNVFPSLDFQVGQMAGTLTQSDRYLTCTECHDSPACNESENNNIYDCVKCHTRNSDLAFNGFTHTIGDHSHNYNDRCGECHQAAGGIGNYGKIPCDACHNMRNQCRNFEDYECAGCHGDECYNAHDQPIPEMPWSFNLLEPEDETVIDTLTVSLSWEAARDNDRDDELIYLVELATESRFRDFQVFNALDETDFNLSELENGTDYWWRIRALDLNTEGARSRRWQFHTSFLVPPTGFHLLEPADGDTIGEDESFETELIWQESLDVNPDDDVLYKLILSIETQNVQGVTYVFDALEDTTYHFDVMDFIEADFWESTWKIEWEVASYSEDDTVWCDTSYVFYIAPKTNNVWESQRSIPTDYSISSPYPNPFNSTVNVVFGLPAAGFVDISIYDIKGCEVSHLAKGIYASGYHTLSFNAEGLSSGLYLIQYNLTGKKNGLLKALLIR